MYCTIRTNHVPRRACRATAQTVGSRRPSVISSYRTDESGFIIEGKRHLFICWAYEEVDAKRA